MNFLVLNGHLTAGEGFLFGKLVQQWPYSLKINQAKKELRKAGFARAQEVLIRLSSKRIIIVDNSQIAFHQRGILKFLDNLQNQLSKISSEFGRLKLNFNKERPDPKDTSGHRILLPEDVLLLFSSNKPVQSEKIFLDGTDLIHTIETIERLASLGILKIQERSKSRQLSLTSEGAALRYLFYHKHELNQANYDYLEKTFLKSNQATWETFLENLNHTREEPTLSSWQINFIAIITNLSILMKEEGKPSSFTLKPPEGIVPLNNQEVRTLKEEVSGFIPMMTGRLLEVLIELQNSDNPISIGQNLELGPSGLGGSLKMLTKFGLVQKLEKKSAYKLTSKGEQLVKFSDDMEEMKAQFAETIEGFKVFESVRRYAESLPDNSFGFIDLAGYFRASGVENFNPAKALSVMRLMTQLHMGIMEQEGNSGAYRLTSQEG
ncbi:MAG: hypothetical protein ACFFFG_00450 [Candidatus Thorarchaeota archaeon]